MMTAKSWIAIASLSLALTAWEKQPEVAPAATATPEPIATVAVPAPTATLATPAPVRTTTVTTSPEPTACGAENLQNYLNLLPTSTAKDEIARTLGHNRVRYVPLQQEKAEASPKSTRVTAGVGVDGRIKEFSCG
jgi:hypothetical protein